jgi:hypothetical protein
MARHFVVGITAFAFIASSAAFAAADPLRSVRPQAEPTKSGLPADDSWITVCLIYADAGEDFDECLRLGGIGYVPEDPTTMGPDTLQARSETLRQTYIEMMDFIAEETHNPSRDDFDITGKQPVFEQVVNCGIHFSSGEHPISVRCQVSDPCTGVFTPDVILSVSWDTLIWNEQDLVVKHGIPAGCAVAFDLDQLPASEASCAQEIVDAFNQAASCSNAGLFATQMATIDGVTIDIYYTPQSADSMPIPGPSSTGTLTK